MTKLLLGLLGAVVIGTGGYAAAAGLDDAAPARTVSLPAGTTTSDDAGATAGATTVETDDDIVVGTTPEAAGSTVDVSGPCDEAEHADDPRCTGVNGRDDDDRSGSNSSSDHDDNDDDHDDHDDHDDD